MPTKTQRKIKTKNANKDAEKDKDKEKEKETEKPQKLYPHLEVILSCEKLEIKEAPKITEEERKILIETLDKQKENFKKQRKFNSFRRRRNFRFGFRRQRFASFKKQRKFNSFRRRRNFRFGFRRQRFASGRRNVNNNRYNRNGRNWSYSMNSRKRPRQGYNNRNNRRMFQKSPAGRRFNNNNKASNPVRPPSRNQSANKEPAKN